MAQWVLGRCPTWAAAARINFRDRLLIVGQADREETADYTAGHSGPITARWMGAAGLDSGWGLLSEAGRARYNRCGTPRIGGNTIAPTTQLDDNISRSGHEV